MRIFVTGATGFIGSAVVEDLLANGHHVLGLARSDAGKKALEEAGAEVHYGSLGDLESLRRGARAADAVAHLAFIHDFSRYQQNIDTDRAAIEALTNALAASGKPLVTTFGLGLLAPGVTPTEDEAANPAMNSRGALEPVALAAAEQGVRASFVRLPPTVHGAGDHGFVPMLITIARQKGFAACVEDGQNLWAAVHRLDAAKLYRLAIEECPFRLSPTCHRRIGRLDARHRTNDRWRAGRSNQKPTAGSSGRAFRLACKVRRHGRPGRQ